MRKLKKKVIFAVILFFELFVSFLCFSVLLYKLLKLENYYSLLNFGGNLSLHFDSASAASFLINAQFLYSSNFLSSFKVSVQMSLGSLSSLLFHIHVSHRIAFILQAHALYLERQQCLQFKMVKRVTFSVLTSCFPVFRFSSNFCSLRWLFSHAFFVSKSERK